MVSLSLESPIGSRLTCPEIHPKFEQEFLTNPHLEPPPRLEYPRDVAEPGTEQPVELLIGDEVVHQLSVLGPHLLGGGLILPRVEGEILALVMRLRKRAVPGSDRVVAARLDLDVVWRVGVDQVDRRPAQQVIDVFHAPAVPTQKPVVARFHCKVMCDFCKDMRTICKVMCDLTGMSGCKKPDKPPLVISTDYILSSRIT